MADFSGLRFFVRDCARSGRSREYIVNLLTRVGLTEAQADRAFEEWTSPAAIEKDAARARPVVIGPKVATR